MLLNNPVFWHIIPFDGNFFDDTEQTVFSLVMLNLVVLGLFFIAMLALRDQQRAKRAEAKAASKLAKTLSETSFDSDMEVTTDPSNPNIIIVSKPSANSPNKRIYPKNQANRRKKR